jgi:hypothetical protein
VTYSSVKVTCPLPVPIQNAINSAKRKCDIDFEALKNEEENSIINKNRNEPKKKF